MTSLRITRRIWSDLQAPTHAPHAFTFPPPHTKEGGCHRHGIQLHLHYGLLRVRNIYSDLLKVRNFRFPFQEKSAATLVGS